MASPHRPQKLLYVLSDGGRARLVGYDRAHQAYVTLTESDNSEPLQNARAASQGRALTQSRQRSGSPSVVGEIQSDARLAKQAFMGRVADLAVDRQRADGFDAIVVAAPPRLINELRRQATSRGMAVAAAVAKDLTKTPDNELGAWFNHIPSLTA
jgi:protein required for attachment to host cells